MTFGDRITLLRKENGYPTRNELAEKLNIPSTTLRNYETNAREPGHTFLKQISEFFNVSVDYLLGITDNKETLNTFRLNIKEQGMVEKYRDLDPHGKKMVDFVLDEEYERSKTVASYPDGSTFRILAYYGKIAAAGKGVQFEDMIAGTKEFPLTEENQNADYTIGVSGDSMEPTFSDGDIVYVKKIDSIQTGDIGIFQKDNEIFIKEVGDNALLSHKEGYPPITDNGDIRLLGKVLGKAKAAE